MVMPQMNGPEMLEQIKQYDSRVMTVLLTGHSNFELTQNAVNSGEVYKILSKPTTVENIVKIINECVVLYTKNLDTTNSTNTEQGRIHIATVWPPTERMSRWIFAVSGYKPVWYIGVPEKLVRAITENFVLEQIA